VNDAVLKLNRRMRPDNKKVTRGDLMVEFLHTLKLPDGPDAGRPLRLRDWQINDIKRIYDPEKPYTDSEGNTRMIRSVRQAVETIGRKNGKTSKAAGLLLGHLVGPEASWNAQLYSAAYEREQAALIYRAAMSMVMQDDELRRICRPIESSKVINCAVNNSRYKALSAESRSKHGLNPTLVLFDELAQFHTDRELLDVLLTSMGAQVEPLLLVLSTQAADDLAVLSQMIDYGREVNSGATIDDSFVLIDYSTPNDTELAKDGESIWDEAVWYRANPGLGDFRSLDEMRQFAQKAAKIPSLELTFRNLYLNQRTAARAAFVTPAVWNLGSRTFGALEGRPAIVGLDLSSRLDLTAWAFCVYVEEEDSYELVLKCFMPKEGLEEKEKQDRAPYRDWIAQGYITATPGKTVDYSFVAKELADEWVKYDMRGLAFDRWRMEIFKKAMEESDLILADEMYLPFGQGFKDMSPAVESFEELLVSERLVHGGNPVLRWAVANAVIEKDAAGNRKLTKAKSTGRIDPVVAAVMAVGAFAPKGEENTSSMISSI
jgi:phage terminase large subunit-like protein